MPCFRLTGHDNVLLGYNFKLQPLLKKKLKDNFKAVDSLCFGHLLFEIAAGFELDSAHPGAKHMSYITDQGLADVSCLVTMINLCFPYALLNFLFPLG